MSRLPPRPELSWRENGTPVDNRFGDIYFSVQDGLSETRTVFLSGCGLPEAWCGKQSFTIAELGFGTGLNFLAVWQMWQARREPGAWLHFVSFEAFLLDVEDVCRALSVWPELKTLSDALCAQWPKRARGVQQIVWPEARLSLTLHIGPVEETLPQAVFCADAWFLDGFSPAKNAQMWQESLWSRLAALSRPGTRLASFTVAGQVRRGLMGAGFRVEKKPGHGRKRERLEAVFAPPGSDPAEYEVSQADKTGSVSRIAILGAGIAGACLAYAFNKAGCEVVVYDQAAGPGAGASGNPLALIMPRLDAADTAQARLLIEAYIAALNFYSGKPGVSICPTEQIPRDKLQAARFLKLSQDPPLASEDLSFHENGSLLHHQSLVIQPHLLLDYLLSGAELRLGQAVKPDLTRPVLNDEAYDAVIMACGPHIGQLCQMLDLSARLGQVDWVDLSAPQASVARANGHYMITHDQKRLWGATFEPYNGTPLVPDPQARATNLSALKVLSPDGAADLTGQTISGRASIRASTPDRLPLIGRLPDSHALQAMRPLLERRKWQLKLDEPAIEGVYLAGGYGSRGFSWAPWGAKILRAQLMGWPVSTSLPSLSHIDPARQLVRRLKRGL